MNHTLFRASKSGVALFLMLVVSVICPKLCEAHKEEVHAAIARSAALSSDGFSGFVNETLGDPGTLLSFQPLEFTPIPPGSFPPIYWITNGAYYEDFTPRFGDHFYTVTADRVVGEAKGLTDGGESLWILPTRTTNSFAWATVTGQPTPVMLVPLVPWFLEPLVPSSENIENWGSAREYQIEALTSELKSDRDEKMAHMFYALGHIIHLNEDLSQPGHTRNDAHPPWGRADIEDFGFANFRNNPQWFATQPHGWAYWRDAAGFNKLRDFWDRGLYRGTATALDEEATDSAPKKLGLAEFNNGNFMSEDTVYSDRLKQSSLHYFPFPSIADTTELIDTVTLENGKSGQRTYLTKNGAGRTVTHHSARKYLAVLNSPKMEVVPPRAFLTINDSNVLQDYHSILIPKAIEYSAGILDYFFRGKIDVGNIQLGLPDSTITVTNLSGQDLFGGEFTILSEAANGNRTSIATKPNPGSLANNATIELTFTAGTDDKYIVVYKGTIGSSGGQALDPVDNNIAIAVKNFTFPDYLWWKMEETSGDRIDSHHGVHLQVSSDYNNATETAVSGKIGNAVEIYLPFDGSYYDQHYISLQPSSGTLSYTANGVAMTGWFKMDASGPTGPDIPVWIGFYAGGHFFGFAVYSTQAFSSSSCYFTYDFVTASTSAQVSAGVWHFFVFEADSNGLYKLRIDGNNYSLQSSYPVPANQTAYPYVELDNYAFWGVNNYLILDELGLFPTLLNDSQKDYLYNGGNGRALP